MIPLKALEKAGYTDDKLKAKFLATDKDPKIQEFIDMVDARTREGLDHCMRNARIWGAIDDLMSRPLQQLTATIARHLADNREALGADLDAVAKQWGISGMLTQAFDPQTNLPMTDKTGRPIMGINMPVFRDIFVPLSLAYTKARWATAFNAIDTRPLYKYSPNVPSDFEKLKCSIIEGVIERQNAQMGYRADERQLMLQQFTYGQAFSFPQEPWYQEFSYDLEGKKQIVKAGIRSAIPHPSKCYVDLSHRTSSVNSDTGTDFGMYWDLYRWRAVRADKKLWVPDRENFQIGINAGTGMFSGSTWAAYQTLFPCQLNFPTELTTGNLSNSDNRSDRAFYYTTGHLDAAVALCNSFHRVIPADFGLFDYDEPVWLRCKTAFSRDMLHVEPFCYSPLSGYFYDRDDHRVIGSSIPLEVAPFEDQIGNLLTQFVITIRRNLQNFMFFNSDGLSEADVEQVKSASGRSYTSINFIPISFSRLGDRQIDPRSLLVPVVMPLAPTAETLQGIRVTLDIVDRLIGFSAHEAGTVTPHEITATEDTTIRDQVSERRRFTLSFSEDGMRARQRMLYDATMAYGEDNVFVEVAIDQLEIDRQTAEKLLTELGFTISAEWNRGGSLGVTGTKTKLYVDSFATGRTGINKVNDVDLAKQFLQVFQSIFSNPAIAQAVGVETMIGWFNNIAIYAGLPSSMRLRMQGPPGPGGPGGMPDPQQLMAAVQQMVAQMGEQQLQSLGQAIQQKMLAPMQQEIGNAITEVVRRISRLEGAAGIPPEANQDQPNEGNPTPMGPA